MTLFIQYPKRHTVNLYYWGGNVTVNVLYVSSRYVSSYMYLHDISKWNN